MFMKIIIILIACFLLSGCGYDKYQMPEDAYINLSDETHLVYDELHLYDLIEDTNTEILTKNKLLSSDIIGKNKIIIECKYEKRKYKLEITYEIVDETPPVFISAAGYRTIALNNDYYPCDEIVFGDNYDKTPTCEIEGEYDITTTGTYNVKYVIKDSSNNETKKNLKITVVRTIGIHIVMKIFYLTMIQCISVYIRK